MDGLSRKIVSTLIIFLCVCAFSFKGLETFLDYFTQSPSRLLTTFYFLIPALLTLTFTFLTILHFFRTLISNIHLRQIPSWTDKIIFRGLILLLIFYALIWQTNYFIWLMHKHAFSNMLADFICILCSIFMAYIFINPYRQRIC
jgi:hypothetical protein